MDTSTHKSCDMDCAPARRPVVGRFAPTPSGKIHLGNVFSALMAWASVRSAGGKIILRIEDLDPRAQDQRVADDLMRDYEWLGLSWDEGPYYQSRRTDAYQEALETLGDRGLTYPCFCSRAELHAASAPHAADGTFVYQGTCRGLTPEQIAEMSKRRNPAIRLMVPDESSPLARITVVDRVYGTYSENLARDCGDFLIRRSDGVFAYQLAVVVDDGLMGVTEVVRGRDLLPSAARQTYLGGLLGFDRHEYSHVPLLMGPDGHRLSKRNLDTDVASLRDDGMDAKTIIGRLAEAVGIAEPGESLTADEFARRFSWEDIRTHKSDVVVDDSFFLK